MTEEEERKHRYEQGANAADEVKKYVIEIMGLDPPVATIALSRALVQLQNDLKTGLRERFSVVNALTFELLGEYVGLHDNASLDDSEGRGP